MRIYANYAIAISEVKRDLAEMGILCHPSTMQNKEVREDRDYATLELTGYSYMIQSVNMKELFRDLYKLELPVSYILQEFADRIAEEASNPGRAWKLRPEVWLEFMKDGVFDYTYSERIGYKLLDTIKLLQDQRDTRQAVMTVYNSIVDDTERGGIARVPCSMHYQFIKRGDALHMIYSMRSCDAVVHFPVDVALALMLLEHIATVMDVDVGNFTHQIGSLHMYRKDASGIF